MAKTEIKAPCFVDDRLPSERLAKFTDDEIDELIRYELENPPKTWEEAFMRDAVVVQKRRDAH